MVKIINLDNIIERFLGEEKETTYIEEERIDGKSEKGGRMKAMREMVEKRT